MVSFVKALIKKRNKNQSLSPSLQIIFLKRLSRLLRRGYSLTEALEVLSWDKQMESIVKTIQQSLYAGENFDEALTKAKFHEMIVIYIYFVRMNGDLLTSLDKSILMFEQRMKALEKFKKVSRYPLFLITIFIFLLLLIKQFILPAYADMFQYHTESAASVEFTFLIFNLLFTLFMILIILVIVAIVIWHIYKKKLSVEKQLRILSYIPIYRQYVRLQTSFYFATHMSLFLKTGLSMKNIMEHMKSQNELPIMQYYASIMINHLGKGYQLKDLLHTLPFIDPALANIFQQHNHIEALEKDLATYADFVSENIEQKLMQFIMVIQPVTFSLLGLFIIIIYFSLLWPMFQLIESI